MWHIRLTNDIGIFYNPDTLQVVHMGHIRLTEDIGILYDTDTSSTHVAY